MKLSPKQEAQLETIRDSIYGKNGKPLNTTGGSKSWDAADKALRKKIKSMLTRNQLKRFAALEEFERSALPNPVVDVLHIETSSEIQALQIYSITGQKLKEVTIHSSKNATIDLSHFEPSIYIVQVTTLAGVFSKRFVKK